MGKAVVGNIGLRSRYTGTLCRSLNVLSAGKKSRSAKRRDRRIAERRAELEARR